MNADYIIGIDEAGRGAWAGPIMAGAWMVSVESLECVLASISGYADSKQLSPEKREQIFHQVELLSHQDRTQYAFAFRDASAIDAVGIREANRQCMQDVILSCLQLLPGDARVCVFIDGCDNYTFDIGESIEYIFAYKKGTKSLPKQHEMKCEIQSRIQVIYKIDGDALFPCISLASIVAKVERDAMMCEYCEEFPEYAFDRHK